MRCIYPISLVSSLVAQVSSCYLQLKTLGLLKAPVPSPQPSDWDFMGPFPLGAVTSVVAARMYINFKSTYVKVLIFSL